MRGEYGRKLYTDDAAVSCSQKEYEDAILFYRIGDFYEMFFDDAKIASKELDLVLTGKNAGVEERVPMCGIPYHAAGCVYPTTCISWFKVAICEQTQDPKEAVGLVTRDVIRVITPGTVMQESLMKKPLYI